MGSERICGIGHFVAESRLERMRKRMRSDWTVCICSATAVYSVAMYSWSLGTPC